MNVRQLKIGIAAILLIAAICIFAAIDWRLAVAAFLIAWSHNLEKH